MNGQSTPLPISQLLSEGLTYATALPGGFRTSILTGLERTRTLLETPTSNARSAPLLYAAATRHLREIEQQVSDAIQHASDNPQGTLTKLFQVQAICRLSLSTLAERRLKPRPA